MTARDLFLPALFVGLCIGLLTACSDPETAEGQMAQLTASFPESFGSIQTVRELPDGRVLVADPLGKALFAVDMDSGQRTTVGREGEGPEEYRQPDAVWPLPGDSTLLVDLGNGRLVTLGSDLSFGPTMPIMVGDFQPGSGKPLVLALPQGVDGEGRIYARETGMGMGGGAFPDSANVLRINRADQTSESVVTFKLQSMTQTTSGDASNQNVQISPIPLSPEDAWGVAPDGSVIIARAEDYHLESTAPDRSVTRGPAVSFVPVTIGNAEKEEFLDEQGRSGGGVGIRVEMTNGQMTMGFARGGPEGRAREIDQYDWPEQKPPFYSGRIPVDPSGRAWVRRHVEAGEPSTYDVFNGGGEMMGTVLLDHGKRVVGFGENSVYVVGFDELDLNYLERYAMPTL